MRTFTLLCLLAVCGCGTDSSPVAPADNPDSAADLVKVSLRLNWFPEAEHGGFYAALVHGHYRDEGLDVTILPGGPGLQVTAQVAAGQIEFGVANAQNVLLSNAEGAQTVALIAPLQHSPRCIMVHEKSGITDLAGLQNVTLAMNASSPFSMYLQKKVPLTGVKIVPYPGNVAQFLLNDDFAQQAYVFSEPFAARQQGGDPRTLMVSELGFDPYTSLLIVSPDLIANRPDIALRMVRASVRGWRQYLADAGKTNEHIHALNEDMNLEILAYGAEQIRPLCLDTETTADNLGRMTLARWQTLLDQLVEVDPSLADNVNAADAFTTDFLTK